MVESNEETKKNDLEEKEEIEEDEENYDEFLMNLRRDLELDKLKSSINYLLKQEKSLSMQDRTFDVNILINDIKDIATRMGTTNIIIEHGTLYAKELVKLIRDSEKDITTREILELSVAGIRNLEVDFRAIQTQQEDLKLKLYNLVEKIKIKE